jgi:hypothetical protein
VNALAPFMTNQRETTTTGRSLARGPSLGQTAGRNKRPVAKGCAAEDD